MQGQVNLIELIYRTLINFVFLLRTNYRINWGGFNRTYSLALWQAKFYLLPSAAGV